MKIKTRFRPCNPEQMLLLLQNLKEWLPESDLVYFIMDVVRSLDLSPIYQSYDNAKGGRPPYNPTMMISLLIYAYCIGVYSSRKIEQATHHSVSFRVLTADQNPDYDTVSEFRKRHLKALAELFVTVFVLCQKAGLVKLGHVSFNGSKVKANASKHKAMSYGRMEKKAAELKEEVDRLLSQAEAVVAEKDALYGKGKRGDEPPKELRFKQSRLRKIEEAKQVLEEEAHLEAREKHAEYKAKKEAWDKKSGRRGRPPKEPSVKTGPKKQHNFTDPESRTIPAGGKDNFIQRYNCQAAVDEKAQVIVASYVTQDSNDKQQLKQVLKEVEENTNGKMSKTVSTDSGYFSESNYRLLESRGIDGYIATGKQKHGETVPPQPRGRIPQNATI